MTGELANLDDCRKLVDGADVVVHMAYDGSPLMSGGDLAGLQTGLLPTLNLVQAIQECTRQPRLVYPSSGGAVYGPASDRHPFTEHDCCRPMNSYGLLKLATEHCLDLFVRRRELSAIVLRISNAFGQPLPCERPQGLIGTTVSRVAAGLPVRLIGDPQNVRDYIHVDDVCAAVERAFEYDGAHSVFNIGSGRGHSVREVVEIIERQWGRPLSRCDVTHPNVRYLAGYCVLDVRRAAEALGWMPRITLWQGIGDMLARVRVSRDSERHS